jgi:diguanylate cyclase (GGDEF)-like protein
LGSRALLVEQLNAALARARRSGGAVALLFVDIDGFKRVNDMLGHAVGDELLVQVAQRLRASVREADVCVRLGGDEFVVACTDMESLDLAQVLGERLLAAVNEPFVVHGHEVHVGASIGIATAQGEDTVSVDQMLSNADVAAYRAKRAGRGRVALFDEDLRRRLAGGRRIARGVERLLDEPRLPLLLAPIVELRTGRVVGFDCSVDWSSAGIDDQAALSQVIDEAGLARALDIARLRTVIGQLADWRRQPPGAIVPGLGVVLTPAGAQAPTIGEIVRDQLARSAVAPSLCWIGIPESAVARDVDAAAKVAAALDAIGVGVALRDFGRAVASLEQLRRVPAATVAIAGVLVSVVDGPEAALAAAVVDYARALGRVVAAFGVETEEQAARVAALGCEFASGPAFGAPVAPDEVGRFLAPRSL